MVDLPFGQEGGKLLPDGLDEVWWERGHGRTPSSGSLENSPHDRAACARLSSRLIVSLSAQGLRAPPKKAGRYGAYRAAVHEAQPHLGIELRQVEPITGNGLRIGIIFGDRLLDEAQGLARMAPAVKGRSSQPAEPGLVQETHDPLGAAFGQADQPVAPPFSSVLRVGRGYPPFGPLPAHPHPLQSGPDGFARDAPLCEPLLETHFGSRLQRPQARLFPELPGVLVKQLPQSLGLLGIEGPVNRVRTLGGSPQRTGKPLPVEGVNGVAHRLGVTAQRAGDVVGILAPVAGEKDLAAAQSEGIRRTQARLQSLTLGVSQGTHEYWSFHTSEDKP